MGKREIPNNACKAASARSKLVCAKRRGPATTESKNAVKVSTGSIALGDERERTADVVARLRNSRSAAKIPRTHQPTERSHCPLGLAQFHFLPAPKSGNFPLHCFVLLGVSSNQLKHYRVRTKQCYLISGFRFKRIRARRAVGLFAGAGGEGVVAAAAPADFNGQALDFLVQRR